MDEDIWGIMTWMGTWRDIMDMGGDMGNMNGGTMAWVGTWWDMGMDGDTVMDGDMRGHGHGGTWVGS